MTETREGRILRREKELEEREQELWRREEGSGLREQELEERAQGLQRREEELKLKEREQEFGRREKALLELEAKVKAESAKQQPPVRTDMLYSLSNELLTRIAGFLEPKDICKLARACRLLYGNASPVLYRSVTIKTVNSLRKFGLHAKKQSPLLAGVHHLDLTFRNWGGDVEDWHSNIQKNVDIANALTNLRRLSIKFPSFLLCPEWDDSVIEGFMTGFQIPLPSVLANSLTHCTIGIKEPPGRLWYIQDAVTLFRHPSMKVLTFHFAKFFPGLPFFDKDDDQTCLEELNFIDCQIPPDGLFQALSFPRALKRLTIASDFAPEPVSLRTDLNPGDYFNAISKTPAAKSLECFRFDLNNLRRILVPAPGMHKLSAVRYLEISHRHLDVDPSTSNEYNPRRFPYPQVPYTLESLLPPKLEALKLSPHAVDVPNLYQILLRKEELVPSLKRIVLSSLSRNKRQTKNLVHQARHTTNSSSPSGELIEKFPEVRPKNFPRLRAACEQAGVELILLYEDAAKGALFGEGRGPALWEVADHVA